MISYSDIKIGARVSAVSAQSNRTCTDGEITDLKNGCYALVRGVWDEDTTTTTGKWVHFDDLGPLIVESETQPVAGFFKCKMCTAPVVHGLRLESGYWLCTPCVIKTCDDFHRKSTQTDWRRRIRGAEIVAKLEKITQELKEIIPNHAT